MLENLNLDRTQKQDITEALKLYRLFGCSIKDRETFDERNHFKLNSLIIRLSRGKEDAQEQYTKVEQFVKAWLENKGWKYHVFGPDLKGGFSPPDFKRANYQTNGIWVYQPQDITSAGNPDPSYSLLWSISHEAAHAWTNDELTNLFNGVGKRQGALGIRTKHPFSEQVVEPLSLTDALRALEWENKTMHRQKAILEREFIVPITNEDFLKEYQMNVAGSVWRILTGDFLTPGYHGIAPKKPSLNAGEMNELGKEICRRAAKEMGLDLKEKYH
ncbi:MAG: hypothetical protein AABY16_01520 [Nanoarchaeota archaeon]